MRSFRVLPLVGLLVAGCALPEEELGAGPQPEVPPAAVGETVVVDPRVGALQLYAAGEEASLPVISLTGNDRLQLEFDLVGQEFGSQLEVTFVHTDREGNVDLLPNEYLTRFETDRITDYERSGASVRVPYVHYRYTFPNDNVGFGVSGNYRVLVRDGEVIGRGFTPASPRGAGFTPARRMWRR